MTNAEFPLLSLIILWPVLGAILLGFTQTAKSAKYCALFFAVTELIVTLMVLFYFDSSDGGFQLVERYHWISSLNVEFFIGVDGFSVLFLPLSALLTLAAIVVSWHTVKKMTALHYAMLLLLEAVTLGVFVALDMVLFFLFWELTLPPIFFLISLWGIGPFRRQAAMKYTLYMLFSGVPLLFAIIILAVNAGDTSLSTTLIFSFPDLIKIPISSSLQTVVFFLLVLAFAVKAPLVPFHTWLPTTAMEAPTQMTALLTGLKLGAFAMLRFCVPLAPQAAQNYHLVLGVLGGITIIYGALIALRQTNLRRMLACASISHVGAVIVGIATLNIQGLQGAFFQLLNFTLISSCLMLIAGFLQYRVGSTECTHLGGIAKIAPKLTGFYFLFVLASIGLPATSGFPAELMLIIGALKVHPGLGFLALLAVVLSAAYMLDFTRRSFWGVVEHSSLTNISDLQTHEMALLSIFAILVLLFGFYPGLVLDVNHASAAQWLSYQTPAIVSEVVK